MNIFFTLILNIINRIRTTHAMSILRWCPVGIEFANLLEDVLVVAEFYQTGYENVLMTIKLHAPDDYRQLTTEGHQNIEKYE